MLEIGDSSAAIRMTTKKDLKVDDHVAVVKSGDAAKTARIDAR